MSWCCEQVFSFTQCLFCGLNYNDGFTFMFTSHLHSLGMSSLKMTIWKIPGVRLTSALFMLSRLFSGCGDILRGFKLNKQWRLGVCSTARTQRIHNLDEWVCSLKCEYTGGRSEWSGKAVGMQVMGCEWKALSSLWNHQNNNFLNATRKSCDMDQWICGREDRREHYWPD